MVITTLLLNLSIGKGKYGVVERQTPLDFARSSMIYSVQWPC